MGANLGEQLGKHAVPQGGKRYGFRLRAGIRRKVKEDKSRFERRKARQNPEAVPTYGKYSGWWW